MKRSHAAAAALLLLLATPALTGCFSGKEATTTAQATMNTGNGVQAQQGDIHIENATLVMGPDGSKAVTLIVRLVNAGPVADKLVFAKIDGTQAYITGDTVDLAPGASISFGFDSEHWINGYAFDKPVSTYVPVELGFQEAGLTPAMQVLTVPPVGYYEGIAPNPPQAAVAPIASISPEPVASATPEPVASATPSAS